MQRLAIAVLLTGCCYSPTASPDTPTPAPSAPAGPSGPGAPGCPDLTTAIVGTWTREGLVEEYREDGTYVINGVSGTYRFTSPGRAVLDEPSTGLHAEYDLGLADPMTLVAINPGNVALTYARSSAPPSIPAHCFDLGTAFARTWMPRAGGPPEVYSADGAYTVSGTGRWSFTAPGRLLLVRSADSMTTDYVVAMPSATTMLAVRAGVGAAYDAAP
ncbi:MAG: hypothetical protein M3Y87_32180 [Myxococcota bacterium]|nr:hypothetical protein [Myxococcota bacterium]